MKTKTLRGKSASVATSRWAAYATAGAATALGCAATTQDAVGAIHYSGPINQHFSGNSAYFQLDQPGDSINPVHLGSASFGVARFFMYGVNAGSVAGFSAGGAFKYASKLGSGINLNGLGNFVSGNGTLAYRYGYSNSQWTAPGTGFVGFRFNGGSGLQYGWARLTMDGAPGNTFTLVDFAYGDFGDHFDRPGSGTGIARVARGRRGWISRLAQTPRARCLTPRLD